MTMTEPLALELTDALKYEIYPVLRDKLNGDKLLDGQLNDADDTLLDYITLLVANGRPQADVAIELESFIGEESASLTAWLWNYLKPFCTQSVEPLQSAVEHQTNSVYMEPSRRLSSVVVTSQSPPPPPLPRLASRRHSTKLNSSVRRSQNRLLSRAVHAVSADYKNKTKSSSHICRSDSKEGIVTSKRVHSDLITRHKQRTHEDTSRRIMHAHMDDYVDVANEERDESHSDDDDDDDDDDDSLQSDTRSISLSSSRHHHHRRRHRRAPFSLYTRGSRLKPQQHDQQRRVISHELTTSRHIPGHSRTSTNTVKRSRSIQPTKMQAKAAEREEPIKRKKTNASDITDFQTARFTVVNEHVRPNKADVKYTRSDNAINSSVSSSTVTSDAKGTTIAPSIATVNVNNKKDKLIRCTFWPACDKSNTCNFHHPSQPCKFWPHCELGRKCMFIHPSRKKQNSIFSTRRSSTPSSSAMKFVSNALAAANTSIAPKSCRFGVSCFRADCKFVHPVNRKLVDTSGICRYDTKCTKISCKFSHPKRDSNGFFAHNILEADDEEVNVKINDSLPHTPPRLTA